MDDSRQPFIWIPVISSEQGDVHLKDHLPGKFTGKIFAAGDTDDKRQLAPISRENLEDMVRGFEGYEVEMIELNVVGGIKTGGALQFIIAGKAEAGMTVTLKKKKTADESEK